MSNINIDKDKVIANVIQFSGGLDSTYIAHLMMSGKIECDLNSLYFVYVKCANVDSKQQECEMEMIKKSLEYLNNKHKLNFNIDERLLIFENNVNGNSLPMNKFGYGSQGIIWISMLFQLLAVCKIDHINVYNGNIMTDTYQSHLHHIRDLEEYIHKATDYNTKLNVITPIAKYTKTQVLENIIDEDIELLNHVHFCEVELHEMSNVCPSCDTFYKAVTDLIEHERCSKNYIENIAKYLFKFRVVIKIENHTDVVIRTPIMYGTSEGEYKETRLIKYFRDVDIDQLNKSFKG